MCMLTRIPCDIIPSMKKLHLQVKFYSPSKVDHTDERWVLMMIWRRIKAAVQNTAVHAVVGG